MFGKVFIYTFPKAVLTRCVYLQIYSWYYSWVGEQVALLKTIYYLTVSLGKLDHLLLSCGAVFTCTTTERELQALEEMFNITSEIWHGRDNVILSAKQHSASPLLFLFLYVCVCVCVWPCTEENAVSFNKYRGKQYTTDNINIKAKVQKAKEKKKLRMQCTLSHYYWNTEGNQSYRVYDADHWGILERCMSWKKTP